MLAEDKASFNPVASHRTLLNMLPEQKGKAQVFTVLSRVLKTQEAGQGPLQQWGLGPPLPLPSEKLCSSISGTG